MRASSHTEEEIIQKLILEFSGEPSIAADAPQAEGFHQPADPGPAPQTTTSSALKKQDSGLRRFLRASMATA